MSRSMIIAGVTAFNRQDPLHQKPMECNAYTRTPAIVYTLDKKAVWAYHTGGRVRGPVRHARNGAPVTVVPAGTTEVSTRTNVR